jgi:antirestriction protein ArdC
LWLPRNVATGRTYRNGNVWELILDSFARGFSSPDYATYKQIEAMGGQVKKGSKAAYVHFMSKKKVPARAEQMEKADENGMVEIWIERWYAVFNIDQVEFAEGKGPKVAAEGVLSNIPDDMDEIVSALDIDLRWGGDNAYYSPALDFIGMPKVENFRSVENFKATLLHETRTGRPTRTA